MLQCYKSMKYQGENEGGYWKSNEADENELIYILPDRTQSRIFSSPQNRRMRQRQKGHLKSLPNNPMNCISGLSVWDRLVRSRNIWCLPNISRSEAETFLHHADVGNFILRVNHQDNAMVLSRCVQSEAPDLDITESENCVHHNIIEVLPRSGYCLTGDSQARLVFSSLIQMLYFYIRLPRKRGCGGPFLRLPQPVVQAKGVQELDQINRTGKDFWRTLNSAKSGRSPSSNTVQSFLVDRRARTNSADHRLDDKDEQDGRSRRGRDFSLAQRTSPTAPHTSVQRARASSLITTRARTEKATVNDIGLPTAEPNPTQEPQKLVRNHLLDINKSVGVLNRSRNRSAQNGIYEGEQCEPWKFLWSNPPRLNSRVTGIDLSTSGTRCNAWPNKATETVQQLKSPEESPDATESQYSLSKRYNPINNSRNSGNRTCTSTISSANEGSFCRTLDEHLRSMQDDDTLITKGNFTHQVKANQQSKAGKNEEESDPVPGGATFVDSGHGTLSVKSEIGLIGSKLEQPLAELPVSKTVGPVFVMEAATYCNNDYEMLSDSVSGKSHRTAGFQISRASPSSLVLNHTSGRRFLIGQKQVSNGDAYLPTSEVPNVRRSFSMRSPGTGEPRSNNDSSRTHETRIIRKSLEKISIGITDTENQRTVKSNHDTRKTGFREAKLQDAVENVQRFTCDPRNRHFRQDESDDSLSLSPGKLHKHPLTVASRPSTNDNTPPNCLRLRAKRDSVLADSCPSETALHSQPPSSRTSTVFCPPWEEAPAGVYLSDLISITGESKIPSSLLGRRTVLVPDRHQSVDRAVTDPNSQVSGKDVELRQMISDWMHSSLAPDGKKHSANSPNMPLPPPHRGVNDHHPGKLVSSGRMNYPEDALVGSSASGVSISPYAVTTCTYTSPESMQRTGDFNEREALRPQADARGTDNGGSCGVYDEAFVENENINEFFPHRSDRRSQCKSEEMLAHVYRGGAESEDDNMKRNGDQKEDHVYAQVVPRHLRRDIHGSMPLVDSGDGNINATRLVNQPKIPTVTSQTVGFDRHKLQCAPMIHANRTFSEERTLPKSTHTISSANVTPYPLDNVTPTSTMRVYPGQGRGRKCSGSSNSSSQSNSPRVIHQPERLPYTGHPLELNNQISVTESKPTGFYIKKFVKRLLKDKESSVSQKLHLFVDCTKNMSHCGPYRMMQCTRQFINGLANHLLNSQDLGLSAAVEMEKKQLDEFAFLNITFLMESILQTYVLRPLYRYFMRQLKQEQLKNTEMEPLRVVVQLACFHSSHHTIIENARCLEEFGFPENIPLPSDTTVKRVGHLFREIESTSSIPEKINGFVEIFRLIRTDVMGRDILNYSADTSGATKDLYAVYTWALARAGVLLAPVISMSPASSNELPNLPTMAFYSPAALQADFLDGLVTDSQLSQQAINHCGLTDLFSTLYWTWSHNTRVQACTQHSSPAALSSVEYRAFDFWPASRTVNHETGYVGSLPRSKKISKTEAGRNKPHLAGYSFTPDAVVQTVQRGFKNLANRHASADSHTTESLKGKSSMPKNGQTNSMNRAHSNQSTSDGDINELCTAGAQSRWRPWIGNTVGLAERPSIRVVVMDEKTNRMSVTYCAARPNITAADLCNMLAYKMRIFDPKQFGLFLCMQDKEYRLPDHYYLAHSGDVNLMDLSQALQPTRPFNDTQNQFDNPDEQQTATKGSSERLGQKTVRNHGIFSKFRLFNKKEKAQLTDSSSVKVGPGRYANQSVEAMPSTANPAVLVYRRVGSYVVMSEHTLSRVLSSDYSSCQRSL